MAQRRPLVAGLKDKTQADREAEKKFVFEALAQQIERIVNPVANVTMMPARELRTTP